MRQKKLNAIGLHTWLSRNIVGYKSAQLQRYLIGFSKYLGEPNKSDTPTLAQKHFDKWVTFVKTTKDARDN